jgi:hypothetical protein
MPLFTNANPLDDVTRNASDRAGIAIIRAIEEAFYGLEAYEFSITPLPEVTINRLRVAEAQFELAAALYRRLAKIVPEEHLTVSQEVLEEFGSAFQFRKTMGGSVLSERFADEWQNRLSTNPISARQLIEFAAAVSEETALGLEEVPLVATDAKTGHRLASDLAVIQMLGLVATRALAASRS